MIDELLAKDAQEQELAASRLLEDVELAGIKVQKRKKSLLISLALFAVSVLLTIIISAVQGTPTKEKEYVEFNPDSNSSKAACIEATALITVIEETNEAGNTFQYLAYQSSNSTYEKGLIKVSQEVYNDPKVREMVRYSEAIAENRTPIVDKPTAPVTFYGYPNSVPEDLSDWISLQRVTSGFPKIDTGKMYLSGDLEKETYTDFPPTADVTIVISIILIFVIIVLLIMYKKAKKNEKLLKALAEGEVTIES